MCHSVFALEVYQGEAGWLDVDMLIKVVKVNRLQQHRFSMLPGQLFDPFEMHHVGE